MIARFTVVIILFAGLTSGTTYYIDYDNGSDNANGLSQSTAWKHAPGDNNATGNANSVTLQAGNTVLFKGGVVYRGSITVPASGASGNPITYKGDGWGAEKAMIDGSDVLATSWTKCTSADQVKGNANYASIYYTTIAVSGYDYSTGTFEDHAFIYASQSPVVADLFHADRTDQMRTIYNDSAWVSQTTTTITDQHHFTQTDPNFYNGAYVAIWHSPNVTNNYAITGFDPATHTITHEPVGGGGIYTDRDAYYAIVNNPAHINGPGQYSYNAATKQLYVWPAADEDPTGHDISYSVEGVGIYMNNKSHLVIEGLVVQKSGMGIRAINNCQGIVIKNNWVRSLKSNNWYAVQVSGTDMYVENNTVENCHRAVGILLAGTNVYIRYNTVRRTSRQGIWTMGTTHGIIADNLVDDINGTHANGISAYLYNKDILIARNRVMNSQLPMTWHGDRDPALYVNLTIFGNLLEGRGQCWGNEMHGTTAINNTFTGGFFTASGDDSIVNVNNIQHAGGSGDIVRSHNVYTAFGWWQRSNYGWYIDSTEIDFTNDDLNLLYADTAADNYAILENSVAKDAGTDPTAWLPIALFPEFDFTKDLNGNTFGADGTWDIGAYEFKLSNIQHPTINIQHSKPRLLPNPLPLSRLNEVYDIRQITGQTIDRTSVCPGIYMVKIMETDTWHRVVIIR